MWVVEGGHEVSQTRPEVVTQEEWQREIDALRVEEKKLTRLHDELNAKRRQLPMVRIEKEYEFQGVEGLVALSDLFAGRQQLIVYHFMFGPDDTEGCPGCSWVTDAMSHPAHLQARDTSLVLISRAPLDRLIEFRTRMGWTLPWYSSFESEFNFDFGATTERGENHMVSVFTSFNDEIYRTYYTDNRGVEHLGSHWTYLDLTPYGRREDWEVSPAGWPRGDNHWTRHHDRY